MQGSLFPTTAVGPIPHYDSWQPPKPLDIKRPIRWTGDDGQNVFVEIQGNMVAVAFRAGPLATAPEKRQEIGGFSRGSRLRLFKLTNRLDFPAAGRVTFLTTTWRDEVGRPTPKEITRARSAFAKSLERQAGKRMSGIWRVEWQIRKSGSFVGTPMPHIHTLYFRAPWIEREAITVAWARAIGWQGRVSLQLREVTCLRSCLSYVSKYIAKADGLSNLDIVSYLAAGSAGRQWGIYRRELLPLADKWEFRIAPGTLAEKIRAIATRFWGKTNQQADKGFVVFGDAAAEILALCEQHLLTGSEHTVH